MLDTWCCFDKKHRHVKFYLYSGCSKHSRRFAGLEACFFLVTVGFFLFLFDKFRLKHLLKHANKKNLARIAAVYQ